MSGVWTSECTCVAEIIVAASLNARASRVNGQKH
ncbi:uncharacterized protein G2W53_020441 [Senna tora]|uniref:Uncharacterized protein n=1 Tax=Senna tora TaxID=362788 RepID=A0A834TWG4_9FABA|nr:uncharacterized protein G2W53_020441 [Senna tora]